MNFSSFVLKYTISWIKKTQKNVCSTFLRWLWYISCLYTLYIVENEVSRYEKGWINWCCCVKIRINKTRHKKAIDGLFATISATLANEEKIQIAGFGTFEVRERGERTGRNPQTGEQIVIPATKAPAFKPGKEFKEAVK